MKLAGVTSMWTAASLVRADRCLPRDRALRCRTPHRLSLRLTARLLSASQAGLRLPLKACLPARQEGVMEWRRQCLVYLSGALFKGGEWLKEQKTMTGFLPPIQPFEGMLERE